MSAFFGVLNASQLAKEPYEHKHLKVYLLDYIYVFVLMLSPSHAYATIIIMTIILIISVTRPSI